MLHAHPGETLWETAHRLGIEIPHLCHKPGYRPDGNCRACVVEIEGERTLAPSCCRTAQAGMVVQTDSPRARKSQHMVLEMLLAEYTAYWQLPFGLALIAIVVFMQGGLAGLAAQWIRRSAQKDAPHG